MSREILQARLRVFLQVSAHKDLLFAGQVVIDLEYAGIERAWKRRSENIGAGVDPVPGCGGSVGYRYAAVVLDHIGIESAWEIR